MMLEDDRKKYNISDLGKAKISEEMKMLDKKRTKALQEKLRKKMLEKTLERQEELMAKKLLEKQTLNIDEANNINTLLKNRAEMKEGGPGIEALRQVAPEVVERMGFQEGGGDILDKRLKAMVAEETKYAKEYGDDYFKKGTGLFGRLGRSLGDSGEGLRAFTEMRKANNQLGDKYTNEQLANMLNEGYSNSGLEYTFTLPEKFKSDRKKKADGGEIDNQMLMVMSPPMESEMESKMPMESDDDMEDNYTRFIMEEALSEEEEDMLTSKLEQDEELSMLFDKIIDVAQEFAGSGPVEGPGSGVSDSIPARLSDGEFVFTAKAVEEIGEDALMSMMKEAEAKADERQGFAEGELVEEETVTMPVERQPIEQNIRVTKETVGPQAGMLEQDDLVDSEVKKSMFRQNRFL